MLTAVAGSVAPETRRGRTAPTVQPSTKLLNSSVSNNNTEALCLQRLKIIGIIGVRANLFAQLAWGKAA